MHLLWSLLSVKVEALTDRIPPASYEWNVLSCVGNSLRVLVFLKDILSPSCLAWNDYVDIVYRSWSDVDEIS